MRNGAIDGLFAGVEWNESDVNAAFILADAYAPSGETTAVAAEPSLDHLFAGTGA